MKFIILQENLKDGLNTIERIIAKSLTLPILNCVLIKTEKNFLTLTTTDLEIGIHWFSLVKIEEEGSLACPVRILSNFVNFLPQKPIKLISQNKLLEIECENYKTRLISQNPEDFPIIPQITTGENVSLDSQFFCQSLSQVVDLAISSTTRPEISGIYFVFQKDLLKMAATDTFRLGEKSLRIEKPAEKVYSFILPQKAAREVINIFGEKKGELTIYFNPNQVLFEFPMTETPHPKVQLISRLIEGEYPNYQEIIPKKYETQLLLLKNEFLNQIKSASLFSGKINEVKFKINPQKNEVLLSSQNPDLGEYQSSLSGKIKGQALEISFNHRFLLDGLLNIKSSEIIFELNGEGGPAVLKPVGDQTYLYVVMPIKAS